MLDKVITKDYLSRQLKNFYDEVVKANVDDELSEDSVNPVQNGVITEEINNLKNSVGNGKALVADAITEKGVETAANSTFQQLANNILDIQGEGYQIELVPITEVNVNEVDQEGCHISWVLPEDSTRSGIQVRFKTVDDFGLSEPSGEIAFDTNTITGTDVTSCVVNAGDLVNTIYVAIYSYCYINNQQYFRRGSVVNFSNIKPKGYIIFNESGIFTAPPNVTSVDVCLVGGGSAGGDSGETFIDFEYGRNGYAGGSGGKVNNLFDISIIPGQQIPIIIGAGVSFSEDSSETIFGEYSSGDAENERKSGAPGARCFANPNIIDKSIPGSDGIYAFNDSEFNGLLYGAGGGSGQYYGKTLKDNNNNYEEEIKQRIKDNPGGVTGGGSGATFGSCYSLTCNGITRLYNIYVQKSAQSGQDGTGAGGGGGIDIPYAKKSNDVGTYSLFNGGSGASGCCIIRWGY